MRSKEELAEVSRQLVQRAAAQVAADTAPAALGAASDASDAGSLVDSASESFDFRQPATPPTGAASRPQNPEPCTIM